MVYEFPTGDAEARVILRKIKVKPQWLITAWAAGGKDRPVSVTIPELGKVSLCARIIGTVYNAAQRNGKAELVRLAQDDK